MFRWRWMSCKHWKWCIADTSATYGCTSTILKTCQFSMTARTGRSWSTGTGHISETEDNISDCPEREIIISYSSSSLHGHQGTCTSCEDGKYLRTVEMYLFIPVRWKDFSSKVKCIILAQWFSVLQNLLLGSRCRHGMSKQQNVDGFALSETKVLEFHMSLWFFKGKSCCLPYGYHILLCASIVLQEDGWQPGQFFMKGFDSFLCSTLHLKFKYIFLQVSDLYSVPIFKIYFPSGTVLQNLCVWHSYL